MRHGEPFFVRLDSPTSDRQGKGRAVERGKMSSQVAPSNRPEDSAFKQQRLKAWQPILTPLWVILTFVVIGAAFIPIGIVLKTQSDGVFEQVILYDADSPDINCRIHTANAGYSAIQNGTAIPCDATFTFTQDIAENTKVNIYYQLTNFYQNHRRYVKSRSDPQVAGKFVAASSLGTSCDPNGSFVSADTGLIYAPCGLIATSFFNDAYFVKTFNGNPSASVTINDKNIAWSTDMSTKFKNPTNPPGTPPELQPLNSWTTYQYLWQTYDQMSCYDNVTSVRVGCDTWADVTLIPTVFGKGCARCAPGSIPRYEGGIPPPGGPDAFVATPGAPGNAMAPFGFRDEHFVVWMRTAGLPTFRKLYGVLTAPPGGFKKGDVVTFEVVPNFEVSSFGGTKALVLSTTTVTGGKSSVLGIAYLVVGSICIALALAFSIKHIVAPRKLGDPQYIVWRHGGKQ